MRLNLVNIKNEIRKPSLVITIYIRVGLGNVQGTFFHGIYRGWLHQAIIL